MILNGMIQVILIIKNSIFVYLFWHEKEKSEQFEIFVKFKRKYYFILMDVIYPNTNYWKVVIFFHQHLWKWKFILTNKII